AVGPRMLANSSVSRCRVRVVRKNGTVLGYVSPPKTEDHPTVVTSVDDALALDIPRMDTQQNAAHIRMIARDDNNNIPYPFLGLESYHTSYGYHWRVRACERGPEGSVFKERARANTTNPVQEASAKVWSRKWTAPLKNFVCSGWRIPRLEQPIHRTIERARLVAPSGASQPRFPLQAIIQHPPGSSVQLWMRKAPINSEESVKLILERFE
ncbi:hypothetical protein FRB95_010993, partial [Tulasnella sp. JGI-2019a]